MLSCDFLKAADIGIPAAQVSGGLCPAAQTPERRDEVVKLRTSCRACISNCGVIATVKNGRVVKLEGDPENPDEPGAYVRQGLSGIQALYNPNRNKYPLIRVGKRGENKWKRISWDEAIDIIARKLMDIRAQYGAESVMCSTGGGGNPSSPVPPASATFSALRTGLNRAVLSAICPGRWPITLCTAAPIPASPTPTPMRSTSLTRLL